jgi:hypothetical protein
LTDKEIEDLKDVIKVMEITSKKVSAETTAIMDALRQEEIQSSTRNKLSDAESDKAVAELEGEGGNSNKSVAESDGSDGIAQ